MNNTFNAKLMLLGIVELLVGVFFLLSVRSDIQLGFGLLLVFGGVSKLLAH